MTLGILPGFTMKNVLNYRKFYAGGERVLRKVRAVAAARCRSLPGCRRIRSGTWSASVFDRYLFRELVVRFLAVFVVMEFIVVSAMSTRVMERVAHGKYAYDALLSLIVYVGLEAFAMILSISMVLAVLLTFRRYERDGESYAVFSSGVGYWRICRTLLKFSLPLSLLLFLFMSEMAPVVEKNYRITKVLSRESMDLRIVTAGKFIKLGQDTVLFVEGFDRNENRLNNIFITRFKGSEPVVETAKEGKQLNTEESGKRLYFHAGYRYQGVPGETNFQVSKFNRHWIRLPEDRGFADFDDPKMRSSSELWSSSHPADKAELQRRLSMSVSLVLMALFTFAAGQVFYRRNVRRSDYLGFLAISLFYIFYLSVTVLLTKLAAAHAVFGVLVWSVHLLLGLFVFLSLSDTGTALWARCKRTAA